MQSSGPGQARPADRQLFMKGHTPVGHTRTEPHGAIVRISDHRSRAATSRPRASSLPQAASPAPSWVSRHARLRGGIAMHQAALPSSSSTGAAAPDHSAEHAVELPQGEALVRPPLYMRILSVLAIVLPFLGLVAAVILLWGTGFG